MHRRLSSCWGNATTHSQGKGCTWTSATSHCHTTHRNSSSCKTLTELVLEKSLQFCTELGHNRRWNQWRAQRDSYICLIVKEDLSCHYLLKMLLHHRPPGFHPPTVAVRQCPCSTAMSLAHKPAHICILQLSWCFPRLQAIQQNQTTQSLLKIGTSLRENLPWNMQLRLKEHSSFIGAYL